MNKRSRGYSASSSSDIEMASGATPSTSAELDHPVKYAHVGNLKNASTTVIRCALPPHKPLKFYSIADYEVHYQQLHSNRCPDCGRNFPSDHYVNLHIADNHNPLNEVLRERGDATYACFVEDCDYKFKDQHKRKMHAIDKHSFPKFYDFFIVNDGIDKRTSMLRPKPRSRKSSRATTKSEESTSTDVGMGGDELEEEGEASEVMSALTTQLSALNFIPRGVRFGKGQRGGFKR